MLHNYSENLLPVIIAAVRICRRPDTFLEQFRRRFLVTKRFLLNFAALVLTLGAVSAVSAQADQPSLQYDSLQVTAWTNNSYKGNYDVWSWVPRLEFKVNGPIPSGSQLYAEFQQPGGGPWLKFDCDTQETQKGY